jgi:hypothetical protein
VRVGGRGARLGPGHRRGWRDLGRARWATCCRCLAWWRGPGSVAAWPQRYIGVGAGLRAGVGAGVTAVLPGGDVGGQATGAGHGSLDRLVIGVWGGMWQRGHGLRPRHVTCIGIGCSPPTTLSSHRTTGCLAASAHTLTVTRTTARLHASAHTLSFMSRPTPCITSTAPLPSSISELPAFEVPLYRVLGDVLLGAGLLGFDAFFPEQVMGARLVWLWYVWVGLVMLVDVYGSSSASSWAWCRTGPRPRSVSARCRRGSSWSWHGSSRCHRRWASCCAGRRPRRSGSAAASWSGAGLGRRRLGVVLLGSSSAVWCTRRCSSSASRLVSIFVHGGGLGLV